MTWRILGYHLLAFLLLASHVSCQFEDDAISPDVYPNAQLGDYGFEYEDRIGEEEADLYGGNGNSLKRDRGAVTTYLTPFERFIKAVMVPFGWGQEQSDKGQNEGTGIKGAINTIISGIKSHIGAKVRGTFGEVLNNIGDKFEAIYPGTEWCGAGNSAEHEHDLGVFAATDRCCRDHDRCTISLEAGTSAYGLENNGIFTRSHCQCDNAFYHCLKQARSLVATKIGLTYYNILRPQCFKEEHPAHCVRYGSSRLSNNKCIEYSYDYSQNKTWQWFDSPDFL